MGAIVRPSVPTLDLGAIEAGVAVRGRTWIDAAAISNHLRGRGHVLVPLSGNGVSIPAGTRYTFRFVCTTSASSRARRWQFHFGMSSVDGGIATVRAPAVTGGAQNIAVGGTLSPNSNYGEYFELATGIDDEEEITVDILNNASVAMNIHGISCVECPRARLDLDATDLGVDENTEVAREPVLDLDNAALTGIVPVLANSQSGRRGGLYYYSTDTSVPYTNATTSYADLTALYMPVLGRRLTSATATLSLIQWRVYCRTSDSSYAGEVRLRSNSDSSTIAIPTSSHGSWAWFPPLASPPEYMSIDAESHSSTDGRQTAGTPVWDELIADARRTSGSGTLSIAALCVEERG